MVHSSNQELFVSVIIPCRNEERFIGECLNSIIAQDYPKEKMEILVVDGRGEDKTREIIAEYHQKFPFIRVLDNPKRWTPSALNIGIKNAKGEVIIRIDAHATYKQDYISKCVQYLHDYDADNVGGIWNILPQKNTLINKSICLALASGFGAGDAYYRRGYSGKPKWVDTVFCGCYKREVFDKIGLFNENLIRAQDLEFNLRLRKAGGRILLVPEIVAFYYPRATLRDFFWHNFQEGVWVTLSLKFAKSLFRLRHYLPLLFVGCLFTSLAFSFLHSCRRLFLLMLGMYLLISLLFSAKIALKKCDIRLFFIMPLVFAARHFAYGIGSIWGLIRGLTWKSEPKDQF